jgi:hypothetical protein
MIGPVIYVEKLAVALVIAANVAIREGTIATALRRR